MKAAILAGGSGSRLRSISKTSPKPLVPIDGVPLIERVMRALEDIGIEKVVIVVRHNLEVITYFSKRKNRAKIRYITKDTKDTIEAFVSLAKMFAHERKSFLYLPSDLVFDTNMLRGFVTDMKDTKHDMVVGASKNRTCDFKVEVDENWQIKDAAENLESDYYGTGIYLCSPVIFKEIPMILQGKFKNFENIISMLIKKGYSIKGYEMTDVYDVDTPDDLLKAERFLRVKNKVIS